TTPPSQELSQLLPETNSRRFAASTTGTSLANVRSMLAEQYQSVHQAHLLRNFWAWYHNRSGSFIIAPLLILATIAAAGVPGWRLGVLFALTVGSMATHSIVMRVYQRPEQIERALVVTHLVVLPLAALKLALTGGLGSPMLVLFMGFPASAMLIAGPRRGALVVMALAAGLLVALAFEPVSWAGPPFPHAYMVALSRE